MTIEQLVWDYLEIHQRHLANQLNWFASRPTLAIAIDRAARARGPRGAKFSHQWRIPNRILGSAAGALQRIRSNLAQARTFADLHGQIRLATTNIKGFGDLAVYDTALRIGSKLGLLPEEVYLQAGARIGARCLEVGRGMPKVVRENFDPAIQILLPHEIENFLCIQRGWLQAGVAPAYRASHC